MGEGMSASWAAEAVQPGENGTRLRVEHALAHGVAAARSRSLLALIGALEAQEYDDAAGVPLSASARLDLWCRRSELAGHDPEAVAPTASQSAAITAYWAWLTQQRTDAAGPEPRLRTDAVQAVAAQPEGHGLADEAWRAQGALTGVDTQPGPADALAAILQDAGSDGRAGMRRSHDAALLMAELSGLPPHLIDLHRTARDHDRAVTTEAVSAAGSAHLRGVGLDGLHGGNAVDRTTALGMGNQAPVQIAREDAMTLRFAVGASDGFGATVERQALLASIEQLRRGAGPTPGSLYKSATGVWRDQVGDRVQPGRRSGLVRDRGPAVGAPVNPASVSTTFAPARGAVMLELDRVYRTMTFDLDIGDVAAVFPVDVYGSRLSADFRQDHLLAAFNCLRALAAAPRADQFGVRLAPHRAGQREITSHMARTAPDMWGGEGNGRQLRRGFAGAVACVAQTALARIELGGLPVDVARMGDELVGALGRFCSVAVVDGLGAMLLRYRLTRAALRAREPQTERWHAYVRTALARMDASMRVLLVDPAAAARAGAPALGEDLDLLADRIGQLAPQGPGRDLGPVVAHVEAMAAAVRVLPSVVAS